MSNCGLPQLGFYFHNLGHGFVGYDKIVLTKAIAEVCDCITKNLKLKRSNKM